LVGERRERVVTRAKYISYGERRDPQEISKVLGSLIERASLRIDIRQGELVKRWAEIVPHDWVEAATPIGIKEQILLVEVPTGTAGSLLKYQTGQLMDAIADTFGDDLVTAVRLRVTR